MVMHADYLKYSRSKSSEGRPPTKRQKLGEGAGGQGQPSSACAVGQDGPDGEGPEGVPGEAALLSPEQARSVDHFLVTSYTIIVLLRL